MPVRAFFALLTLLPALSTQAQLTAAAYEQPPAVLAADLLPPEVRQSGHHRVRGQIALKGDMYVFDIDSDYGLYRVESLSMLLIRTHEVRTLAQAIGQYNVNNEQFAEELRGKLTYNAHSLVDVVKAPFSMAGQLVNNIGQTAQELSDLGYSSLPESDGNLYVDDVSSDVIGGAHKRNIAYQLNLDPYSTNPRVQEFLNTVARARSSGHFTAGMVTVRVPPSRLVTVADGKIDQQVKNAVKGLSPRELDQGIEQQLIQMGVDRESLSTFLKHPNYSPKHKTAITAYLDHLRGVRNRAALIRAALVAQGEADALSFEMLARMLAHYHYSVGEIAELDLLAELPIAITRNGNATVIMPVDYIYWDARSDQIFAALGAHLESAGYADATLVIAGTLSEKSRAGIDAHGFKTLEQFLFR